MAHRAKAARGGGRDGVNASVADIGGAPAVARCIPIEQYAQWDALFRTVARPHFTQAWCYGDGKNAVGWTVQRLLIEDKGGPLAICQVLVRKILGLPLVSRINRGPLFLDPAPESRLVVLRALRRHWQFARRGLLLFAPSLEAGPEAEAALRAAGFVQRNSLGWGSALIDLTPPLDAIRAGVSSKWRNHLKNSLRQNLELRLTQGADAIEWILAQHAHNMARKNFAGPPLPFVRGMTASGAADFTLFQAMRDAQPCSAILVSRHGTHAETFLSWTGEVGRQTHAHHFLLWQVIEHMKARGCSALDLGGYTTSDKYGAYKRAMKGREYRLAGEWLAF